MRFAAISSVVILALATAGVTAAQAPKRTSLTGKISVLKLKKITVHGTRNLTCRITAVSPRVTLRGFTLGTRARITCVKGVLAAIARPGKASAPTSAAPVTPSDSTTTPKPDPTPGTGGVKIAPTVNGTSTITALGGGQIEFGAAITCQITAGSPSVAAYRVGSRVSYTCEAGSLRAISAGEGV